MATIRVADARERTALRATVDETVADELGSSDITANVIHPASTATERIPALLERLASQSGVDLAEAAPGMAQRTSNRRYNTAQDINDVAVFLASELDVAINGEAIDATGVLRGRFRATAREAPSDDSHQCGRGRFELLKGPGRA